MTHRMNKCLLACVAIPVCSLFATSAQAATAFARLDQISPNATSYIEVATAPDPAPIINFARFNPATTPVGEVTATVQFAGIGDPTAGDFTGFIAGNIALIDRGTLPFVDKIVNAEAAGATGVLIANTATSGNGAGVFQGGGDFSVTTVPAVMISFALGEEIKNSLATGAVEMHIATVPEPSSLMLGLLAMTGFGLFGRRRRQKNT